MNAQRDSDSVPASSWRSARLFVTDEFTAPPVILRVDDSVIGTLGNFSASTGKAKSKKTFNVCAIVAAAMMGGTVLNYSASLPPERRRILYVDTEQSRFHCKRVLCRILRLAGLPTDTHPPLLEFLCLRGYATKERLRKIEEAIYDLDDLGLVVIDGIRDLAHDINSPGEATDLITKLMQWTDERRIHIHTVLHLNKGDDNTRGHLGTELNNKAETVLQITKDDFDRDVSSVAAMHIRDRDFEPFAFRINADALPEPVKVLETEGTGAVVSLLENKGRLYLLIVNRDYERPMRLTFYADESVGRVLKDGSVVPAQAYTGVLEVDPGDAMIYTWTKKRK